MNVSNGTVMRTFLRWALKAIADSGGNDKQEDGLLSATVVRVNPTGSSIDCVVFRLAPFVVCFVFRIFGKIFAQP